MAYDAKTNWTENEIVNPEDMNRIEQGIKDTNTNKAPNSHASSATTYGIGTSSLYGHLKLINNLTTASAGQGALDAYQAKLLNDAITGKAQTNHASAATTFGVGGASVYGHCRVLNQLNISTHTDGFALSAYQGFILKGLIDTLNSALDLKLSIDDLPVNIMQRSVAQTMTQPLTAGGAQAETTSQVRNVAILPSGTIDFSSISNNTLILVKE